MTDCMALYCTEPFFTTLPSAQYDLNNVGRDVKDQTINVHQIKTDISKIQTPMKRDIPGQ